MWLTGIALSLVLAGCAWSACRSRPEHRPIALFVSASLVADVLRRALAVFVLQPARAELGTLPYAGTVRLAFHLEQAGALWRPAGLAALAAVVLGRRRGWPYAAAWALALVVVALAYPSVRGASLAAAYLAADLAAIVAVVVHGLGWWRRSERGERPRITEGSVVLLGAVELMAVVAYRQPFGGGWAVAQVVYLIAFAALIILHLGESTWISSWLRRSP